MRSRVRLCAPLCVCTCVGPHTRSTVHTHVMRVYSQAYGVCVYTHRGGSVKGRKSLSLSLSLYIYIYMHRERERARARERERESESERERETHAHISL